MYLAVHDNTYHPRYVYAVPIGAKELDMQK